MSATQGLMIIAAAWIGIGLVSAMIMGRRGHSPVEWWILGAILGPLVVALALGRIQDEIEMAKRFRHDSSSRIERGPDRLDVLIGLDGSPEAAGAMARTVQMLEPAIGSVTLATVIDFGFADTPGGSEGIAEIEKQLAENAARIANKPVETRILVGHPADALSSFAREHGCELIVVGARGRGLSKALLGSVAQRLASRADVPVLIGSTPIPGVDDAMLSNSRTGPEAKES